MKTPRSASRATATAPAAGLESVIGYLLAQAAVTAGVVFEREVGAPLQLLRRYALSGQDQLRS